MSFNFKQYNIGKFDYRILMHNPNICVPDEDIIQQYKTVISNLAFRSTSDEALYNQYSVYEEAKKDIVGDLDINYVVDNIVLEIFALHKTLKKKAFWTLFGDIVYNNIRGNLNENRTE